MKYLVLFTFVIISQLSIASEQISVREIKFTQTYATLATFHLKEPANNADGCTRSNSKWVVGLDLNDAKNHVLFSKVLAAKMAGKPVGFGVGGCIGWGDTTIPKVYRVDL